MSGENYRSVIQNGFGIRADYIFGSNISKKKIDMTSPVKVGNPEKVPMTAPVKVSGNEEYTVAFIMPKKYSIDTLPEPLNKNISFKKIPSRKVAAVRFSGFFNQKNIIKNISALEEWLSRNKIRTEGEHVVAGYNPPWVPWFLARNEVIVNIK